MVLEEFSSFLEKVVTTTAPLVIVGDFNFHLENENDQSAARFQDLFSGPRQHRVRKLQYVQNSAARLLTGSCKHEHITPVLRNLHWLAVHKRIRFKILLMTFKCLNQLATSCLSDLLIHYQPSRTLPSSDKELLVQPRCHLKTHGERAFSFIAPKLWNTLPLSIKRCKSVESFKSTLKTHLFKNYFEL